MGVAGRLPEEREGVGCSGCGGEEGVGGVGCDVRHCVGMGYATKAGGCDMWIRDWAVDETRAAVDVDPCRG